MILALYEVLKKWLQIEVQWIIIIKLTSNKKIDFTDKYYQFFKYDIPDIIKNLHQVGSQCIHVH